MLLTQEEKDIMAEENYSLVYFVANKFLNTKIDVDELASVATVGFVKALNAYDKSRNIRFSTYSVNCMQNEILYFLRKERQHINNTISMSFTLSTDGSGNDFNMEDVLSTSASVKNEIDTEKLIEISEDSLLLYQALGHLTRNERYIAVYRFGLDQGIKKTQREIAEDIGMSQANVSKIEKGLLVKMKDILSENYSMSWGKDGTLGSKEEEGEIA